MTSARERAVEAGAWAIFSETYAHDLAKEPAETIELYHGLARNCLRAAFPILAEELAAQIEDSLETITHDERLETADLVALRDRDHKIARALRARIQQMGEKLE